MQDNEKAVAHFRDPHNVGYINAPDGVGQLGIDSCGDSITMFIRVERNRLADIKYVLQGCGTLAATCSVVSDLAKGLAVEDALQVTPEDISSELGGLPPDKAHCAKEAVAALRRAVEDYRRRSRVDLHDWRSMYGRKS